MMRVTELKKPYKKAHMEDESRYKNRFRSRTALLKETFLRFFTLENS